MINGLEIKTKYDSISDSIEGNEGPIVLYGLTVWSALLIRCNKIHVDYVCDRKNINGFNETCMTLFGVPIVDIEYLKNSITEKRATIIACVDNKYTFISICNDLLKDDINADVFNYFENIEIFSDKFFEYKKEKLKLFEHPYNCGYVDTRMTERSVELALALKYISTHNNIYEIGAVTPYYFEKEQVSKIIDPTDSHKRVTKASLFDIDLTKKNVLSISTVEHIGTTDFGMCEKQNSIDAINKILSESNSCLITAPYGYNKILDEWVQTNISNSNLHFLQRTINNHWEEVDLLNYNFECMYTPLWANGLIIIEKS